MSRIPAIEFLDRLMAGEVIAVPELLQLISQTAIQAEGLHLDYKACHLRDKSDKEWGHLVREYVSAFANSAGGSLVLGVTEPSPDGQSPREALGCEALPKGNLHEWATRCLQPIAHFLSGPPRIQIVEVAGAQVLIIGVFRSTNLVPVIVSGQTCYFLRIGDSTVRAPDYLISDLVLGHRRHPSFAIRTPHLRQISQVGDPIMGEVSVILINDGISHAEWASCGFLAIDYAKHPPLALSLSSAIAIETIGGLGVAHLHVSCERLLPFQSEQLTLGRIRIFPQTGMWELKCALYVGAKGAPPSWFQFTSTIMVIKSTSGYAFTVEADSTHVVALHGERPTVSITKIGP